MACLDFKLVDRGIFIDWPPNYTIRTTNIQAYKSQKRPQHRSTRVMTNGEHIQMQRRMTDVHLNVRKIMIVHSNNSEKRVVCQHLFKGFYAYAC